MAEVVAVLRDQERAMRIIDAAYREVALNPDNSFAAMVEQVDYAINRTFRTDMFKTSSAYSERAFEWVLLKSRTKVAARRAIVGAFKCAAIIAPSPIRRWGKRRLTALPRVLGFGELDVTK